jgi:thymidylate kinase
MVKPNCVVVALEGLDAVGKTTAAAGLRRELTRMRIPTVVRHAEKHYLKAAFRLARERNEPRLKYLIQACAAQMLASEIACAPKDTVFICDRYFTSARAYYLALCGAPDLLHPEVEILPRPDVAVLLDCAPAVRRERLRNMPHQPSARKMRAADPAFSARMREILLPAYAWVRIDTERTGRDETIVRIRDLVMEVLSA